MIDQYALFQLENIVKNIRESYENYQFFKIFQVCFLKPWIVDIITLLTVHMTYILAGDF